MPISDQMFLAATTPPDYMQQKLRQETLRTAMLQNQHAAIVNPQVEAENRQKLATGEQSLQQGAISLLTAQQDQEDSKNLREILRGSTRPATMTAAAPAAGQVPAPQNQIVPGMIGDPRPPAAQSTMAQLAAPQSWTPPGVVGVKVTPAGPSQPQTWEDVADQLQQGGAQPRNVFAFRNLILGVREKAATLAKTVADTTKTQQEVDDKRREFLGSLALGVKENGYNSVAMEAALHGIETYDPSSKDHVAAIRQLLANGVPIKAIIDPMADMASAAQKGAATAAEKQRQEAGGQAAKSAAEQLVLAGELLGPTTNEDEWAAGLAQLPKEVRDKYPAHYSPRAAALASQQGMDAEKQTSATQARANAAETARKNTAEIENQRQQRVQEGQRIGISAGELGLRQRQFNATFGAGLDALGHPLPPDERKAAAMQDPTAVAIANYQIPPPGGRTTALSKAMYDKVLAITPTYDATLFPSRNRTAIEFSPAGPTGKALTSTDTGLSHLALISKAGELLHNTDYKALNSLAQSIGAQVGNDPKNTYDTIVQLVAPEISKAVIGGVGGEGERQALVARFNSTVGDTVRENAIRATAQLLGARYEKNRHAYEEQMNKPLERKLSTESQQLLEKYGAGTAGRATPNQGATGVAAGGGATTTYKEYAIGPGNHRIGSNDDKATWYDVATGKRVY